MNASRKGAALDVLFEFSRLAQSPGTWFGDESSALQALFVTVMKGRRGCEFLQQPITGDMGDPIEEMAKEFEKIESAFRWNPLLQLLTLLGISRAFPYVHLLFLGFSYDIHRGTVPIRPVVIALLQLLWAIWVQQYLPIPDFLWYLVQTYSWYASFSAILNPAWPHVIDTVLLAASALDSALARTEDGRLALIPYNAQVGDEIALFKGSKCPFVVRPTASRWKLVGDCYVQGMMDGRDFREDACDEMDFI
jgi:hypothetical protein